MVVLCLFGTGMVFTVSTAYQIQIPVRVFKQGVFVQDLTKDNFRITINNSAKVITGCELVKNNFRDFAKSRNIILKFTTTYLGDDYKKTLDFIVKDVVKDGDRLIIWSPTNRISEIKLRKDRLQSSNEIFTLLKKDTLFYLAKKKNAEKQIAGYMGASVQHAGESLRLFDNCLSGWRLYKNRYILPKLNNYSNLSKVLKSPGRKSVIIDFHQKNIAPIVDDLRQKIRATRDKYSGSNITGESTIVTAATLLENSLKLKDEYPRIGIINALLAGGVSYHVIFYNNLRLTTSVNSQIADLQDILTSISQTTGGLAVDTNDFLAGVKRILDYTDHYYDLAVKFNGIVEDKQIDLKLNGVKGDMFYLNLLPRKEIVALKRLMDIPQVGISNLKCVRHSLSFVINNYALDTAQKNGLVEVRIIISNGSGKVVFNTGKMLKTQKSVINVKDIRLPAQLKGEMNLVMTVVDYLSGKQAEVNNTIQL
jgi:hypothetical protein